MTVERMQPESRPPGAEPGVLLRTTVAIDPRSSLHAHKHAPPCISNASRFGGSSLAQKVRAGTVPLPQNILARIGYYQMDYQLRSGGDSYS
jgi:hypothetical protein